MRHLYKRHLQGLRFTIASVMLVVVAGASVDVYAAEVSSDNASLRSYLDAPMLFTKRHSYQGIHIYDTYYQWWPGGGIYILENPSAPASEHVIRPVIDANTPETLGEGMYTEPDISADGTRILFCFKGEKDASTSIYEIGLDGTGLRQLTFPTMCACSEGRFKSQHDVCPAYMPDGRIVFKSTRPNGLVPCNNTGVDILHIMDTDGKDIHCISVNNVNEFDPCILPDGRILHGRWEYLDKGALTQQSLWAIFPDGTNETALYANNMVRPEAVLDARPMPWAPHLIVATLARHNSTPRGSLAVIDTRVGKNAPAAISNWDNPNDPTCDTGNSCEPWPVIQDVILFSGRPEGAERNVIQLAHRDGRRETLLANPDICLHAPMLIKPSRQPLHMTAITTPDETTGRFFVQDLYKGLPQIEPGEVKWLRIIEETSRASASPGNMGPYNQTFLASAALAFGAKNFLGIVPVEPDGSAYFEVPAGRALYLQALDAEKRLVQSMRTFVQAAPGVTRSCIGCHEPKFSAANNKFNRQALRHNPVKPVPETWGNGYLDYPSMVQPVLDKHCVECHGGEKGFAARLDLSGGWTEHFNISYENLASRHESQITATLIAGIDCMNGTSPWAAQILPPRTHGSGVAPLAKIIASGHRGRIPKMTRTERDLLMAWIDTNGLYYGTWDYTKNGHSVLEWPQIKQALVNEMRAAGCMECHENHGQIQFENDWFNLERPEMSRILRAPLAKGTGGNGLALCQDKKVEARHRRIRLLINGYAHGVLPLEQWRKDGEQPPRDMAPAETKTMFASPDDEHYQKMLAIIQHGRRDVLAKPRIDMPGADVVAGYARQFVAPPLPERLPELEARVDSDSRVHLAWERNADTIGLIGEIYRGANKNFTPNQETLIQTTRGFEAIDAEAPVGKQHYALVLCSDEERSTPIRQTVDVPAPVPPPAPKALQATPAVGRVELAWEETSEMPLRYNVYRAPEGSDAFECITEEPTAKLGYQDSSSSQDAAFAYVVRAVNRRGVESPAIPAVIAAPLPEIKEPIFISAFLDNIDGTLYGGEPAPATAQGRARVWRDALDLRRGGHVTYDHRPEFDVSDRISIECWVHFSEATQMPVVISCGEWNKGGWFIQLLGGKWRWYVGGINCDGGKFVPERWIHIAATYDGETARLYQAGYLVAKTPGHTNGQPSNNPLHIGQYSAGPNDRYQVKGYVSGVKIYNRVLSEEEARAAARKRPATIKTKTKSSV